MAEEKYLKFSPSIFINGPYIECPKCHKQSFGVLIIASESYSRRCAECFYPKGTERSVSYPLPKLKKKIIYLDQMAISNMMLALNPSAKPKIHHKIDPFWLKLFEKIYTLVQLQQVTCPDSQYHKHESLASKFYKPLQRMYELLSHGVTFYDFETIRRFQTIPALLVWLGKRKDIGLNVHDVVHGKINAWQDRFIIGVEFPRDTSFIDELRATRSKSSENLSAIVERWKSEKGKHFKDWYGEEQKGVAPSFIRVYSEYLTNGVLASYGKIPYSIDVLLPPPIVVTIQSMKNRLEDSGYKDHRENNIKLGEFFRSSQFENVPIHKISSMMFAATARQFAAGRKKPLTQGFSNDIGIISSIMPYCDAMFVDDECRNLFNENPLKTKLNYGAKLFSHSNREAFLAYLEELLKSVSKKHLAAVREVYGPDWGKPYWDLYRNDQRKNG